MAKTVHIPLDWTTIAWMPDETWQKNVVPKLNSAGMNPRDISRSVYVIRLNGDFAVDYGKGESPAVYVGEGNFATRINSHKTWVNEIKELVGDFTFQVCIATPRVKNNAEAYLDTEAALLHRFGQLFGTAPLWNKQFETRRCEHYEYSERSLDFALRKRSGAKYKWAIRPMRACIFHEAYQKTARIWAEKFY
jgi:hypothetical protein